MTEMKPETSREHQWVVDQIDGSWSVLQAVNNASRELNIPSDLLPASASEGATLTLVISVDFKSTETSRSEVNELIETLIEDDDGGDFSL